MKDVNALHAEIAKLQRRAARWKHAAKENREKFLHLCDNMDAILDDILDPYDIEDLENTYTVH